MRGGAIATAALFVLAIAAVATVCLATEPHWGRAEAMACVLRYVDVSPRDGKCSPVEVDTARAKYFRLPGMPQMVLNYINTRLKPTSTIMEDCDFDHDGFISRRDMELSNRTCLRDDDRITFRPFIDKPVLQLFKERFCDVAERMEREAAGGSHK